MSQAYQTLSELQAAGLRPNARTYSILIHLCARASLVDHGFRYAPSCTNAHSITESCTHHVARITHHASRITHHVSDITYYTNHRPLIHFSWFRKMILAGETPNHVTFTTLINACGRSGQLERAFAVLEQMQMASLQPNVVTYTALIDACAKAGQLPRALDVFRSMVSK